MDSIEKMENILKDKERCFLRYEEITAQMLVCEQEELEAQTLRRQPLMERIDLLSRELEELISGLGSLAESARSSLRLSCRRSELPDCLFPLFDLSQQICAITNRIRRNEPLIVDRIEEELEALTEEIKQNNRSVSAKAAKYQSAFATESTQYDRIGGRFGKA